MTTDRRAQRAPDRIQAALEKARERVNDTRQYPEMLAVIEVALRFYPHPQTIQLEQREIALRDALNRWADAVLGQEPSDD